LLHLSTAFNKNACYALHYSLVNPPVCLEMLHAVEDQCRHYRGLD
jgi:hypothetical protein